MSARLAATSGDLSWEVRYKKNEPLLTAAINEALALAPEAKVDAGNLALVDLETRSFDLVRANRLAEASALVFGDLHGPAAHRLKPPLLSQRRQPRCAIVQRAMATMAAATSIARHAR
jgi:hypothetical protein